MKERKISKVFTYLKHSMFILLFCIACFCAMFILVKFHDNYLLVGAAAVLLLFTAFLMFQDLSRKQFERAEELLKKEEEEYKLQTQIKKELIENKSRVDEQLKILSKTQKAIYFDSKRSGAEIETRLHMMEQKLALLEALQKQQEIGVKTILKYNKENARQIAINEKLTLEQLVSEITEEIKQIRDTNALMGIDNGGQTADDEVQTEEASDVETENVSVDETGQPAEEAEKEPEEETGEDAQKPLSDEDIAQMFEEAQKTMEEKLSETGVDLSNPNANLSVEDIAKLFAASGNQG